jgi:hypothetical protein
MGNHEDAEQDYEYLSPEVDRSLVARSYHAIDRIKSDQVEEDTRKRESLPVDSPRKAEEKPQ